LETTAEAQSPVTNFVYAWFDTGNQNFDNYRVMMADSLKTTYPEASVYKLTLPGPVEHIMVQRCLAYAHARKTVRGNLVFLDTDIIAMYRLDEKIWDDASWDVGLVHGNEASPYMMMPYCGGVILSRDTPAAQEWFDLTGKASNSLPGGMLTNGWWVDQLAMAWAASRVPNLGVNILPAHKYNFVPDGAQATRAYFVHLKGPRKHLMRQYYNCVKKTDHTGY